MVSEGVQGMLPLPASAAVVAETGQITAEEWPGLQRAGLTHGILQVWVNLYLKSQTNIKVLSYFYVNKTSILAQIFLQLI